MTADTCERCWGKGYYSEVVPGTEYDWIPDYREKYCDCEAGQKRMKRETE